MNNERKVIRDTILDREKLRHVSRVKRLWTNPRRTFVYYIFALLSHIKPYTLSFKTLWGTTMTSYLPEGNTFYYYGYCEANLTNFLLRFLKEGDIVIDVGAHVGIYTMLSSFLVGKTGQVHSFEPTPWTYDLLVKNSKGLTNVHLNNKAVSDVATVLSFKDYGPGYGAYNTAHKNGSPLGKKSKTIYSETVVLDDYCKKKNITPTLIKLDAEGHEYPILLGMSTLLQSVRPMITLEVAGEKDWLENCKQSINLLTEKGYLPYEISVEGKIRPHSFKDSYKYDNLLFIPEGMNITYDTH